MAFLTRQKNDLIYQVSDLLTPVIHGFSTRQGGVSEGPFSSLNLRLSGGDTPEHLRENYRRFCGALGADWRRTVLARQVHGDTVRTVGAADGAPLQSVPEPADALITGVPGLPLFVFSADCIVILLSDPESGCVGAVHAGWRGTAKQIVRKTAAELVRQYGAKPEHIRAAIGPGIGPCCFETDGDVPKAMEQSMGPSAAPYLRRRGEKWLVDLKGLNRRQLLEAGVPEEQIDVCPLCTACNPSLYWSHRKMGENRGVQAAMIQRTV